MPGKRITYNNRQYTVLTPREERELRAMINAHNGELTQLATVRCSFGEYTVQLDGREDASRSRESFDEFEF